MTISPPADLWTPYRDGLPDATTIDLVDGTRLHHLRWWDGKLLTDFLLLQQVDVGDDDEAEWIDIVRVDCCHQEVHVHRLYAEPEAVYKVLQPIRTPEDLWTGADLAETLVYDEWEEHLRRWEGDGE